MKKAFTTIELVVAVGILAMVLSFAGVIFKISVESQRAAAANAEIMQKLRTITSQLSADFKGLRKDGEIFAAWGAIPSDMLIDHEHYADDSDGHVRFDAIMFFANGDFRTYHPVHRDIRGNVARISYMLALNRAKSKGGDPTPAIRQSHEKRILARTQHILTAHSDACDLPRMPMPPFSEQEGGALDEWHNWKECDRITLRDWMTMPWEHDKTVALSIITGIAVFKGSPTGAVVDADNPDSVHMLLCEGVGEFMVQGWSDMYQRWIPAVDPDSDGDLGDTDFFLPYGQKIYLPGLLYPVRADLDPSYGFVWLGGELGCEWLDAKFRKFQQMLNEEHFNEIPGLGRALKFTFTLYDSKGVIENGRTFSHIVYLDN